MIRGKAIDYFDSNISNVSIQSVVFWMIIAAIAGCISFFLWKKGKIKASTAIIIPILLFFLSFVFTITLIERTPTRRPHYEPVPFWSYRAIAAGKTYLFEENFWNIILFLPIGFLFAALLRRKVWLSIIIGLFLSSAIEVIQLLSHRGLFEFDDIIHNTIGAVIGMIVYLFINKIKNHNVRLDKK